MENKSKGKKATRREIFVRVTCIVFAVLMVAGAGSSLIYIFLK